jgi:ParB family transcriptional regulator, chromosome partitioning protein
VSKDRRLGRGLAALLGTPVDESGIVEGLAAESGNSPAASSPAALSQTGPSPTPPPTATAKSAAGGAPAAPVRLAASTASEPPTASADGTPTTTRSRPAVITHPPAGVTGAVPLGSVLPSATSSRTGSDSVEGFRTADTRAADNSPAPASGTSFELSVDLIDSNPFQPRREFDPAELASLAESIREHQQLQPILVRTAGKRYQLISGERRLRATIQAGKKTIRAEVREADDRMVAELAIVENLQRKDLNPIEKALSFRRYLDDHHCTQEELAKRLKIDRSTIANLMRLLELPEEILVAVQSDKISAGHARALLPLGEESQQLEFAARIQAEGWSVRETERQVTEQLDQEDGSPHTPPVRKTRGRTVTPQIASLEQQLRLSLGTKIEIRQAARGRGKIVVHFTNAEEFERLKHLLAPESPRAVA